MDFGVCILKFDIKFLKKISVLQFAIMIYGLTICLGLEYKFMFRVWGLRFRAKLMNPVLKD